MGPLFIISGPSGVGKTTLIQRVLSDPPGPLRLSVSATTRKPRPGETDGVDYHFWPAARFEAEVAAGAFLEHAVVHGVDRYGTLRAEVEPFRQQGIGVILDIDVQGAEQVRANVADSVGVFLRTSSIDEYERRLRMRRTEDEASIQRRMETARRELAFASNYQYQVVNDDLAAATAEVRAIVGRSFQRTCDVG